jgi:hypothetical protein
VLRPTDFATLSLLRFRDGGLVIAGAHEEIVVWRAATRCCETIPTPGTWVGAAPDVSKYLQSHTHRLADGDVVVLYTDGITEAMSDTRAQFGIERLADAAGVLWNKVPERRGPNSMPLGTLWPRSSWRVLRAKRGRGRSQEAPSLAPANANGRAHGTWTRKIVEVLSPKTEAYDRGEKREHYEQLASLEAYVLVDQERRAVEGFVRRPDNTWSHEIHRSGDAAAIPPLQLAIPVDEIYDTAGVA